MQVNYIGFAGMNVGQAHLLNDIISLVSTPETATSLLIQQALQLELDPEVFERISLSYTLGDQHGLFQLMTDANANHV